MEDKNRQKAVDSNSHGKLMIKLQWNHRPFETDK